MILKLVLMDEEDQHFKMATKASHTTVQRGHGEQFQVWKLEEPFNSIEQASVQSLHLPLALCRVFVDIKKRKRNKRQNPASHDL